MPTSTEKKRKDHTSHMDNVTFTLTFGDQAENHVGMQKIGEGLAAEGFGVQQLAALRDKLEDQGTLCELVDLKHGKR